MANKFKIGDKVRILDGSKIKDYTGSWSSFSCMGMDKYIGTIQTIKGINESWSDGRVSYTMEGCAAYSWDERGLELVTEQKRPKFKVGDTVIGNKKANRYCITREGWIGTITKVNDDNIWVTGPGFIGNYGTFVNSECFDLAPKNHPKNQQKIVITTDGRVTKAAMYEGKQKIKVATSTCHPNDEFDFIKGAAIAFERLTGQKCDKHADEPEVKSEKKLEEKPESKYFTGKVRCVRLDERNVGWLTKGKIYTFINGCSVDDVGDRLPLGGSVLSVEDLNGRIYSDFEELRCFDWDGFKAGKFNMIVNRENIGEFLKACEVHDINWPRNKATEWNPIEKMDAEPNFTMLMLKAALGFESTDKCDLKVEDDGLRYSFSPHIRRETIIYG